MILELYNKLKLIAESEFNDIIETSDIIFTFSGRAQKLRLYLIDRTLIDIWYSEDGDYSYHWEQRTIREAIYRHDNAPHHRWNHIPTFPKHCHDGSQDNVTESNLPANPEIAIRDFLNIVRKKLIELL